MTYSSNSDSAVFTPNPVYQCRYSGCQKESAFDPNTGAQNEYCHEHNIQYIQMLSRQQDGYNPFTTPRNPQWSIGGNTDSSDLASDSSDDDQDPLSSRVQSDGGSLRPTSVSQSLSSPWWANAFSSLLTQQAPSKKPKPQHAYVSPRKRAQSATRSLAAAHARPVTAPSSRVHQQSAIPAIPQATFMQAQQQSIPVTQTVPGKAMTYNILVSRPQIYHQPMRAGGYFLLLY
jgi:hypothetical protein